MKAPEMGSGPGTGPVHALDYAGRYSRLGCKVMDFSPFPGACSGNHRSARAGVIVVADGEGSAPGRNPPEAAVKRRLKNSECRRFDAKAHQFSGSLIDLVKSWRIAICRAGCEARSSELFSGPLQRRFDATERHVSTSLAEQTKMDRVGDRRTGRGPVSIPSLGACQGPVSRARNSLPGRRGRWWPHRRGSALRGAARNSRVARPSAPWGRAGWRRAAPPASG